MEQPYFKNKDWLNEEIECGIDAFLYCEKENKSGLSGDTSSGRSSCQDAPSTAATRRNRRPL